MEPPSALMFRFGNRFTAYVNCPPAGRASQPPAIPDRAFPNCGLQVVDNAWLETRRRPKKDGGSPPRLRSVHLPRRYRAACDCMLDDVQRLRDLCAADVQMSHHAHGLWRNARRQHILLLQAL